MHFESHFEGVKALIQYGLAPDEHIHAVAKVIQ